MSAARKVQRYGWSPDLPDARDHKFVAKRALLRALPAAVDLRPQCPAVYDQGQLGSCTGNAIAGMDEFVQMKQGIVQPFTPSRLFIYYGERVIEGTVRQDAGAQIRDGIKVLAKKGACPEKLWPYDITKFAKKPPVACFTEALKHQAIQYQRLDQTLSGMKACLADGFPFVFGFTVYDAFESAAVARTGTLKMPTSSEKVVGGHAVMCVGYDDKTGVVIVRNSWGAGWGKKGYFTMPYAYITSTNLSDDFWTIRSVEV